MDAYTHNPHDAQQKGCAVEILTEDRLSPRRRKSSASSAAATSTGARRITSKWALITLWQKDEMDALEAVNWLYECGFVKFAEADGKDADAFMRFYSMRERRLAEGRAA